MICLNQKDVDIIARHISRKNTQNETLNDERKPKKKPAVNFDQILDKLRVFEIFFLVHNSS
jgi:hypothetical protein